MARNILKENGFDNLLLFPNIIHRVSLSKLGDNETRLCAAIIFSAYYLIAEKHSSHKYIKYNYYDENLTFGTKIRDLKIANRILMTLDYIDIRPISKFLIKIAVLKDPTK